MPTANPDSTATIAGTPVVIPVLTNDVSGSGALQVVSLTQPAMGRIQLNADQSITYRPNAGFVGTDSFNYEAADGTGQRSSATVTVEVRPADGVPVALSDSVTTPAGTPVVISLLANDADPEGGPLTIVAVGKPGHGAVALGPGVVTYTPASGFVGSDSFSYQIADAAGQRAGATVSVQVLPPNQPPVASDDRATTPAGQAIVIPVLGNDADPEAAGLIVANLGAPANGCVVLNANQTLTYTPNVGFAGTDSFSYVAADPLGAKATATVQVDVVAPGSPPTAKDDVATTQVGVPVTIAVLANDSDPGSGPLAVVGLGKPGHGKVSLGANQSVIYTPDPGYAGPDSFSYTIEGAAGRASAVVSVNVVADNLAPEARNESALTYRNQAVTIPILANDIEPEGEALRVIGLGKPSRGQAKLNANQTVTYTPQTGYVGPDSFTYTIADPGDRTSTASVAITVAEPPLLLAAADDQARTAGGIPVDVAVLANDEGADLRVTGVSTPAHGTAAIIGAQTIRYTPAADFVGIDSFTYQVTDAAGAAASATVTVQVELRGQSFADGTFFSDTAGWVDGAAPPADLFGRSATVDAVLGQAVTLFDGAPDQIGPSAITWSPAYALDPGAIIVVGLPTVLSPTRDTSILAQGNLLAGGAVPGDFRLYLSQTQRLNVAFVQPDGATVGLWAGQQRAQPGVPLVGVLRIGPAKLDIFMNSLGHDISPEVPTVVYESTSSYRFTRAGTLRLGQAEENVNGWQGRLTVLLLRRAMTDAELGAVIAAFKPA